MLTIENIWDAVNIVRCKTCVMPNSRPDVPFVNGECAACINYKKRSEIDWEARKSELIALLDRHDGRCIVPSSGGKDSHAQAIALKEIGCDVTCVTATTCHLTPIGRTNIDNLARHCRTIEVSPNKTVRAKLNRIGLEMVGDISWAEHVSIFTTPFRMAAALNIKLIMYGESPQNQYGGPQGTEQAMQMTRRWRSEFGGFLGLRPSDVIGMDGITERDMADYELPLQSMIEDAGIEAHFLGQYIQWDSFRNTEVATSNGMQWELPTPANFWRSENLDNAQTGLHDHVMYLKYGYGRGAAQASVNVRAGVTSREEAMRFVIEHDGKFPDVYMGVTIDEVLDRIGMSREELDKILDRFTNKEIHGIGEAHYSNSAL